MASITIRNLDDDVKTGLRVRAAEHHRSMEEECANHPARRREWRANRSPEFGEVHPRVLCAPWRR